MERGLSFVYVGNTLSDDADDTVCPECGSVAVRRLGYLVDVVGLGGTRCASCGRDMYIVR